MSRPEVLPEVMRIASERHQKGLMSPWLYQVLTHVSVLQECAFIFDWIHNSLVID